MALWDIDGARVVAERLILARAKGAATITFASCQIREGLTLAQWLDAQVEAVMKERPDESAEVLDFIDGGLVLWGLPDQD
jgi:hypothetical protein